MIVCGRTDINSFMNGRYVFELRQGIEYNIRRGEIYVHVILHCRKGRH